MNRYEQETIKLCSRCNQSKPISEFSKDVKAKTGIRHWCKDCCNRASKLKRSLSPEKYRQISREYRLRHLLESRERCRLYRIRVKRETLSHYGGGKCACVICGETRLPCLSLDHIKGNGSEEYRKLRRRGTGLYSYLCANGFPIGYQTLCMNCQWIKRSINKEHGGKLDGTDS